MDIFGKDFETWIHLDRYGLPTTEWKAIVAFMESNDCKAHHYQRIEIVCNI